MSKTTNASTAAPASFPAPSPSPALKKESDEEVPQNTRLSSRFAEPFVATTEGGAGVWDDTTTKNGDEDDNIVDDRVEQSRLSPLFGTGNSATSSAQHPETQEPPNTDYYTSRRLTVEEAAENAPDRKSPPQIDFSGVLSNTTRSFRRHSDALGQMNEAYNANKYIHDNMTDERLRVARLNEEARRQVYMTQRRHMSSWHRSNSYEVLTRLFVYTTAMTLFLAVVLAAWLQHAFGFWSFIVLAGIIVILYCVIMAVIVRRNTHRRQVYWNQYYWDAPTEHKKKQNSGCGGEDGWW